MSIPRKDPNFTMVDLRKAADKFIAAGQEYWDATAKAGLHVGSVVWIDDGSKGMGIFTRGEYRDVILSNIPEVGNTYSIGCAGDPTPPDPEAA